MTVTTKADSVSADILRKIVRGDLETGALLPKAEALAEDYGVNRSVVREAIKSLEVQNLVQPRKRRGTEVLDPATSFSAEVMSAMLLPEGCDASRIDLEVLEDFLEIRAVLDAQMAALAATNRTDADIACFEACLEAIREARDDVGRYSDAITDLSLAVATATGNRIFPMLVHWHGRVQADLEDLLLTVRQPGTAHLQGITLLVQLIIARDTEAISRLLAQFHAWAIPELLTAASKRNGDTP
ncbi:MAG: GntR family transcriptional regulator [Myxococcota bacterium]|nr:GntR family transcriptional regulator [Myxococcota bacterium]